MRAVLSFFWSGLFGLGKFALLTTSLCVALIVAISGPPTASELAGLRTAAGDALGALDRITRATAEDMCETMSADARETFCSGAEPTSAPVHAAAPSTPVEAPPPPPRVQTAAARLEASLSPDNGQLLGGPGQGSEPARARAPERAERRAEADPPRARSSQRAERRAAAEPRAQTRPARRVAAARTPTQRTAPARARAEPARRRPAERAPVVRAAAPTAPVIEAQRAPAVAEPPAPEPILEPAVGRTPAGGADYGDDAYETAPSSRAARPARARWEEEVEEPPLVEAKDEEWGYEDEDYAEDPYDPDEVW